MNEKPQNFFKVLKILLQKLKGINFALLGTFNLFVLEIKVVPRDLDLLTDDEGIEKIGQIFGSLITEEKEDRYKETHFQIENVEVHAVSNENNPLRPKNFKKHIVWVEKESMGIPCMSLESELLFYQQAGRKKDRGKVRLIKEQLSKQNDKQKFNLSAAITINQFIVN